MELLRYIAVFTVIMGVSEFLMETEITCKHAPLWCPHVHLVVEMIFINQLECQMHHFVRLSNIGFAIFELPIMRFSLSFMLFYLLFLFKCI